MSEDDPSGVPEGPEPEELGVEVPEEAGSALEAAEPGPGGDLQQRARLAEERLAEVLSAYRRVRSENEGFRDRITRNLERRFDQRRERLLLKFIEILDNLDRALEAAELTYAGNPLIEGLILVRTQLLQTLQEEGLERIPVLGMPYDPNFSEAVGTEAVPDADHHHVVVKELLRGYRLNGRVARPSRVVVGEYGAAAAPGHEQPEPLIGADEVLSNAVPAEPASSNAVPALEPDSQDYEQSLEEIIGSAEEQETGLLEARLPDDELQEPALLSEEDLGLGEPLEEPAPKKPRE